MASAVLGLASWPVRGWCGPCPDMPAGAMGGGRRRRRSHFVGAQAGANGDGEDEEGDEGPSRQARLGSILRNKQRVLQSQIGRYRDGELEERLASAEPATSPYRLLDIIAGQMMRGKTAIVAEIARLSPSESVEDFSIRCARYVAWGAHALAVCTDEEQTQSGAKDLVAACKVRTAIKDCVLGLSLPAVKVPVLRKDWILHPLQIVETREAGVVAVTAVYSVVRQGTAAILQFAVNLGLDSVIEVVNLQELQEIASIGAPLYGINISIGLSVSIPGFRQDIAKSLVSEIPFGAMSLVGVWSIEEAIAVKLERADAVYVRREALQDRDGNSLVPRMFLNGLRDAMTGDD